MKLITQIKLKFNQFYIIIYNLIGALNKLDS